MSAIWGIINRTANINTATEKLSVQMEASMSVFPFDRTDTIKSQTGIFACGHQYCTNEDQFDISPIKDDSESLVFCSDCCLYNRDSLINELNIENHLNKGDSQIAFAAFKKWGYSFVEKLRGVFSFAIFEEKNGILHLFSDQFCRRYVVYNISQDYICFSTTYKPVLACLEKKAKINREYIANCFSDITPRNFHKEIITPYENVYHLDYAIHITIDLKSGKSTRVRYWDPIKTKKKLKLKSDEEYKAAFRTLFENQVRSILRSKDETGIQLSGGLDSSSVAAFAAPILKEQGKKLFSYTQVPSSDYVFDKDDANIMINESSLVEMQKNIHSNLIPRYINGDIDCCVSDIEYYQSLFDIPLKATLNTINIIKMDEAAIKDNCSLVLSGSNGNSTISYGFLCNYISINLSKFHIIKALKQINCFGKRYHVSRKKLIKKYLSNMFSYYFTKPEEQHLFLKPVDEEKYGLTHPLRDAKRLSGGNEFSTNKQRYHFLMNPMYFIQKGFYYTTTELKYHFIIGDPTQTVEMIEFCLGLPLECFTNNGIERRLVRDYLKDLLPEPITDMRKPFGMQTADFYYRVNRDFDKIKEEVFRNLDEPLLREYLDPEKINPLIAELKATAEAHSLDREQCIKLSQLAYLGSFLRNHTYQ